MEPEGPSQALAAETVPFLPAGSHLVAGNPGSTARKGGGTVPGAEWPSTMFAGSKQAPRVAAVSHHLSPANICLLVTLPLPPLHTRCDLAPASSSWGPPQFTPFSG